MSELTIEQAIGQMMMLDFIGTTPPDTLMDWIARRPVGGVTLYRNQNLQTPEQVRALTSALQDAATKSGQPPLLIAADQEGGQLNGVGHGATMFAGNMALGAAGSADLARRVGEAIGNELAAMGINVNYAPVCDVLTNPLNPNIGIRPFGDDPEMAGMLAAALIEGMQSTGVAATAKHFPGHGEAATDPHFETPVVKESRERISAVELPPFAAAIKSGAKLIMTTHAAYPELTGGSTLPATLAKPILHDLLRGEMGFEGLVITDALNMGAITQGLGQVIDVIASTLAGVDLLLMGADESVREAVDVGLAQAVRRGVIPEAIIQDSARRVLALKAWVGESDAPSLDVVGCAEHQALATELAERAITLVSDDSGMLPLKLETDKKILVVVPKPEDLTPADTSKYVTHTLAKHIREIHPAVDEVITAMRPDAAEIGAVASKAETYDLIIAGTIAAHMQAGQAELVNKLHQLGKPLIAAAMRTPYDILAYPDVKTYVCTYGILEPSMQALARVLFGKRPCTGSLPVSISEQYPRGHGMVLE